jgi:hypothetical protein
LIHKQFAGGFYDSKFLCGCASTAGRGRGESSAYNPIKERRRCVFTNRGQ